MFFPFIGLVLAVSWSLGLIIIKNEGILNHQPFLKAVLVILASGILSGHAYGTYQRNDVWHTEESLWHDVTIKSPGNGRGWMNYGLTQMEKGDYQKAIRCLEKALMLAPAYAYLHVNLGVLKEAMNQPEEAERYFKNALRLDPNNPEGYYYYARWLSTRKRDHEAIAFLEKTIRISPGHGSAKSLLNEIHAHNYTLQPPLEQTEQSNRVSTAEEYLMLSLKFHNDGRYLDSIIACTEALRINPKYDLAYNNICAAFNVLGLWEKAIEACEKGIRINPHNLILKNNLALASQQKTKQQANKAR
jgi:protein O-mannosyl-transferase